VGRVLHLHIGQPKTGTTHLQTLFTANRPQLLAAGVSYPVYGDDARAVDIRRMVPCGNGRSVLNSESAFDEALHASGDAGRVLFSSELMFNLISRHDGVDWLPGIARRHGFDDVRVLCLLRDPLPFAVSEWQQRVKGWEAETRSLDDYVLEDFDGPRRSLVVLERVRALSPLVKATVLRYESVLADEGGLEGVVASWLGVPAGIFTARPRTRVNRSLTRSEAELQRQLNLRLGRSGSVFGFRLTVDVPDVDRDPPELGREATDAAVERLAPTVARINELLDAGHALALPGVPSPTTEAPADGSEARYTFSAEQLSVIAAGIAEQTQPERHKRVFWTAVKQRSRLTAGRPGRALRRFRL
jgi:hypothetical protein